VIQYFVTAYQVIHDHPNEGKDKQAGIEFRAHNKCFPDDLLSYKIKKYPGEQCSQAIAKRIPADMYSGLLQIGNVLVKKIVTGVWYV